MRLPFLRTGRISPHTGYSAPRVFLFYFTDFPLSRFPAASLWIYILCVKPVCGGLFSSGCPTIRRATTGRSLQFPAHGRSATIPSIFLPLMHSPKWRLRTAVSFPAFCQMSEDTVHRISASGKIPCACSAPVRVGSRCSPAGRSPRCTGNTIPTSHRGCSSIYPHRSNTPAG